MFAVVKTGGKIYRVSKGDILRVERIKGNVGDPVRLNKVLMISDEGEIHIGKPYLANATVMGEIVKEEKGKKVLTYKMKKRKNYRRFKGHRQTFTYLRINEIALS